MANEMSKQSKAMWFETGAENYQSAGAVSAYQAVKKCKYVLALLMLFE